MKKVLAILAVAAAILCVSCKGGEKKAATPEDTAKTALEALKKNDYKAFVNTYNLSDDDKQMLVSVIEEKMKEQMDEKGGIKSYEVGEAQIDGENAVVNSKITYADGSEEDMTFNLVNVDGKWLQEMNK